MPFSGTNFSQTAPLRVSLRFLILPFAIGLVLATAALSRSLRRRGAGFALALLAVAVCWSGPPHHAVAAVGAAAAALIGERALSRLRRAPRRRRIALVIGAAVLLAGLAIWAPQKADMTAAALHATGGTDRPIGAAWRVIDSLPPGSRIAWFGPAAYQYYPLFGRRFQHRPVAVDPDGTPRPLLHRLFAEHPEWTGERGRGRQWDLHALTGNLHAAGVEYVLVTKWDATQWPPQQAILQRCAGWEKRFDDGYSTLWRATLPATTDLPGPQAGPGG
jgi:hypothetical protein